MTLFPIRIAYEGSRASVITIFSRKAVSQYLCVKLNESPRISLLVISKNICRTKYRKGFCLYSDDQNALFHFGWLKDAHPSPLLKVNHLSRKIAHHIFFVRFSIKRKNIENKQYIIAVYK